MKLCEGLLPDCSVSKKKTGAKMTQALAFATHTATYSATNKPMYMYAMSPTVAQQDSIWAACESWAATECTVGSLLHVSTVNTIQARQLIHSKDFSC